MYTNLIKIKAIQILLIWTFLPPMTVNAQNSKIDSLERVLKKHTSVDSTQVNILNELAYALYLQDTKRSRSYAELSGKIADQLNYPKGKAASLWVYGLTFMQSDRKKSLDYFQQALAIGEHVGDKTGICNYLMYIGIVKGLMGDVDSGDEAYQKALHIARELKNDRLIAMLLYNISRSQTRQGDYLEAVKQIQEVIRIADGIGDIQVSSKAYGQLAYIHSRQGNYPIALEYYLEVLKINERVNDKSGMYYNLLNIADIQSSQKEFDSALETIQRAYHLSEDIGDSLRISTCLIKIGDIYMNMDNPGALLYFEKALAIIKDNNINQRITLLMNIGSIYTRQKRFGEALNNFEEALSLARKIELKRAYGQIWFKIGNLYFEQKQYSRAINYAKMALDLADEIKLQELQKDGNKLLSDLYAATGLFSDAYASHVRYKAISDSMFNEKNIRKLAVLESSYAYEKEKQVYESEKTTRELKLKSQKQIIIFLIIVTILILMLTFSMYWTNKLKKKVLRLTIENINHELETNQKSMTAATLKLIQNSERDAYSIRMLENIQTNTTEEGLKEIRSLIADYKFKSNNSNWDEFEILFEKVNSSFYRKLNERYPTLTPNERKLCIFLKLNMSNHHISQITFQSEEALKKARLRLRKKLEIDRETNLTAFIQNL